MRASPRLKRALAAAALLAGLRLAACGTNFNVQSQIISMRVLGVQAEPAELILQDGGPLPSTTLTALAIDPSGAVITIRYALCAQQGSLPAAGLDCPGDAGIDLPDAGPLSARLDLNDPAIQAEAIALFASYDGGAGGAGSLGALLAAGIPLAVGFSADAPAHDNPDGGPAPTAGYPDQHTIGFAEVTLRTAGAPVNRNPEMADINANMMAISADGGTTFHAGQTVTLVPVVTEGSKEALPDGGLESLDFSFYTTYGSLSALRSTDTTLTGEPGLISSDYTAPEQPGPARLWVVVRDGRGGIGWIERDFNVVP